MRVLVVSHLYPSKTCPTRGVFVEEQVMALRARGISVDVLSGRWEDFAGSDATEEAALEFVRLPWLAWMPSPVSVWLAVGVLERAIRHRIAQKRYDLVHAHYGAPDGVAAIRAVGGAGIPVIVTLHGSDVNYQLKRRLVGRWLAGQLAKAHGVICVSPAMIPIVSDASEELRAICRVLPNGFSRSQFYLDSHAQRDAILFVGNLSPVKNPDVLLEAYALVADMLEYDLWFAGEGPMRLDLEAMARSLGISHRVHFLGVVPHEELGSWFSRAVLSVLPSQNEGMPVSAIESLASGVPVVCSAVGALPELVTDGTNGYLVEPGNTRGLADAILLGASHRWNRRRISRDSRLRSWDDVAGVLSELYAEALASHR